jgi:hypothetical protein
LLGNKKISARIHRRAGPEAAQDFARLLEADGKIGDAGQGDGRDPIVRPFSRGLLPLPCLSRRESIVVSRE